MHLRTAPALGVQAVLAVLFCFFISFIALPAAASAAQAKSTPHKAVIQKKSVKKSARADKKSAKTAKKSRAEKSVAAKAAKKSREGDKAASERDIWLKRAQKSEALTGKASWYGKDFHNKATASGLTYDMYTFTAAHRTLPIGTIVKVTEQKHGKSVMVCVTDRGPYIRDRIIDVSYAAAKQLGLDKRGVGAVELEVVSDAQGMPLRKDQRYFVKYAAGSGKTTVGPFRAFADAAAMREALSQAHPEAEVVLEKTGR
ncbi:MAG: septal ring lytic transglycosylase RlpA family protein [Desulfovibrio sp.]|nr:septal ring lytic transglycosylase RlpA family protein [Desulfovibrio sp.]